MWVASRSKNWIDVTLHGIKETYIMKHTVWAVQALTLSGIHLKFTVDCLSKWQVANVIMQIWHLLYISTRFGHDLFISNIPCLTSATPDDLDLWPFVLKKLPRTSYPCHGQVYNKRKLFIRGCSLTESDWSSWLIVTAILSCLILLINDYK